VSCPGTNTTKTCKKLIKIANSMNFSEFENRKTGRDHKDTNITKGEGCAMAALLKTCLGKTHPYEKP